MKAGTVVEIGAAGLVPATGRPQARLEGRTTYPTRTGLALDPPASAAATRAGLVPVVVGGGRPTTTIVVGRALASPHPVLVATRPNIAVAHRPVRVSFLDIA